LTWPGEKEKIFSSRSRYRPSRSAKSSEGDDRCQNSHYSGQIIIENDQIAIISGRSLMNASDIDHHQLFIPLRQNEMKPWNQSQIRSHRVATFQKNCILPVTKRKKSQIIGSGKKATIFNSREL
jgi:5-methylcytosine-specific restriction endonuclease McrBC regulatory subunit McrC